MILVFAAIDSGGATETYNWTEKATMQEIKGQLISSDELQCIQNQRLPILHTSNIIR